MRQIADAQTGAGWTTDAQCSARRTSSVISQATRSLQ
jgi:hypothetical protein